MKTTRCLLVSIAAIALWARSGALTAGVIVARPPEPCPEAIGHADFHDPVLAMEVGVENQDVAVADLDGDGHEDLVVADTVGDRIRIGFGRGDGTFGSVKTLTMGDGPTDVEVADFNADGYLDILATNHAQDRVYVRWGAAVSPWIDDSVWVVGDLPLDVAVGDLNDDGLVDFAAANGLDDTITVRLRQADGGFGPGVDYASGDSVLDLVIADADGDGDLDLIYGTGLHEAARLAVRKNDGAGNFGAAVLSSMKLEHGEFIQALVVADLNEDGDLDVVVAKNSHALVRAIGSGTGTFAGAVEAPTGTNPVNLAVADFNRDGHEDLVVAHFANNEGVSIYLGLGNGNVVTHDLGVTFSDDKAFSVATGDFNEDGFPDVVYSGYYGAHVLLSKPRCEEEQPTLQPRFIRGDANGDRAVDIGDPVATLSCLFLGSRCSRCPDSADSNDDGQLNVGDAVHELSFLFLAGPPPVGPVGACGVDETRDALGTCSYDACSVKR